MSGSNDDELLLSSLEIAADRAGDIVPLVYERLFEARPSLRPIFAVELDSKPRTGMGSMINEVLRLILADDDATLETEAHAAVVFHVGWGLDVPMYRDVLQSVMAAVRDACADAWNDAMAAAWHERLASVMTALRRHHEAIEGDAGS